MNYKKIIILFLAFFIAFVLGSFLKKYFNSLTTIVFEEYNHDFGDIIGEKEVSKYFIYKNTGSLPLSINEIISNCGCTISEWTKKELKSNESDSILVKYNSEVNGYFSKEIYILSNSKTSPDVLNITGIITEKNK